MGTTADFDDPRVSPDWLKRLKQLAHTMRRPLHRIDDLVLVPANVFCLAFLISKLPFERAMGKPLPPSHLLVLFVPYVPFVA
jgi:hypothetical protein